MTAPVLIRKRELERLLAIAREAGAVAVDVNGFGRIILKQSLTDQPEARDASAARKRIEDRRGQREN